MGMIIWIYVGMASMNSGFSFILVAVWEISVPHKVFPREVTENVSFYRLDVYLVSWLKEMARLASQLGPCLFYLLAIYFKYTS